VTSPRFVICAAVLTGMTGCAAHPSPATTVARGQGQGPSFTVSRAHSYDTLADVKQDSVAAVLVRATHASSVGPADENARSRIPATVTRVQVRKLLWGRLAATSIAVRQLGSAKLASPDLPPVLSADHDYVLLVMPFRFHPGASTGQYYITGDLGAFDASDPARLRRMSSDGNLPRQISLADLTAQLQR